MSEQDTLQAIRRMMTAIVALAIATALLAVATITVALTADDDGDQSRGGDRSPRRG